MRTGRNTKTAAPTRGLGNWGLRDFGTGNQFHPRLPLDDAPIGDTCSVSCKRGEHMSNQSERRSAPELTSDNRLFVNPFYLMF